MSVQPNKSYINSKKKLLYFNLCYITAIKKNQSSSSPPLEYLSSGLTVGFLLWEEESGEQDLRAAVRWSFLFQIFIRWPPVLNQVLR